MAKTRWGALLLSALLWSAAAEAQGPPEEEPAPEIDGDARRNAMARALFADGVAQARAGSFARAADFFRRAHALRPTPPIAYNLASALVQLGRLVEASEVLQDVVRHPETTPEMRRAAEVTIRRITTRMAQVRIVLTGAPGDVSLTLDDRPLSVAVLGVMVPIDPGAHVLAAFRGQTRIATVELALAESAREEILLRVPPPPSSSAPVRTDRPAVEPEPQDWEWLIWAGIGVGVAALIATTIGVAVAETQRGPAPAIPGTTMPTILEWR